MNIDPTTMQIPNQTPYNPIGIWFDDEAEEGTHGAPTGIKPATPGADSLSAIEKQFAQLVKDLTQQLNGLERQLSQAFKAIGATKAAPACEPGDCSKGKAPKGPGYHRYSKLITDAARRHEVDPQLVGAVIRQESGFSPAALSKTGAMGLMQLMPDTARTLGVRDAFDPRQNIEGGTALLRQLLDRYHGHVDLALAAYNAGPAAVDKYGGVPPYPETQDYVRNVMEMYRESALSA